MTEASSGRNLLIDIEDARAIVNTATEERCQTRYKTEARASDWWKMPAWNMWKNHEHWLKGGRKQ